MDKMEKRREGLCSSFASGSRILSPEIGLWSAKKQENRLT